MSTKGKVPDAHCEGMEKGMDGEDSEPSTPSAEYLYLHTDVVLV